VPHNLGVIFRVEQRFLVVGLYDRCPPEWKEIDLKALKHPTIILQAYPQAYRSIHAIFVDAYEGPGIEGNVLDRTARVVTPARFICRASVSYMEPLSPQTSDDTASYFQGDELVSRSCKGRLLDHQWWYVG
jgi:hypothetical protein